MALLAMWLAGLGPPQADDGTPSCWARGSPLLAMIARAPPPRGALAVPALLTAALTLEKGLFIPALLRLFWPPSRRSAPFLVLGWGCLAYGLYRLTIGSQNPQGGPMGEHWEKMQEGWAAEHKRGPKTKSERERKAQEREADETWARYQAERASRAQAAEQAQRLRRRRRSASAGQDDAMAKQHEKDWLVFEAAAKLPGAPRIAVKDLPLPPDMTNPLCLPLGATLAEKRAALRKASLRWHPDKFQQKFGRRIATTESEAMLGAVTSVFQAINAHRK